MASTSGCSQELKDLGLSYNSCMMGDSSKVSDFTTTTLAHEADHTTALTSYMSAVEEQIEQSKAHWSMLVDDSGYTDEEKLSLEVSNVQEFQALQRHATYGSFFANFSGDGISTGFNYEDIGELVVGKKFAEGGQAELYEVQIKWKNPMYAKLCEGEKFEFVLKVFKEGTLLKQVKSQLPDGFLLYHVERSEVEYSPTPKGIANYISPVYFGILLKGGRFAFLLGKYHSDLRTLIDCNMKLRGGEDRGPFSKEEAQYLMYNVALGVNTLHNRGIVHRDLKASNVLVFKNEHATRMKWSCYVADYECSVGVVGTHFFRAPEILQVCKEQKVIKRSEVFSKAADVYSYGMTCYEILTGKLPFEDHPLRDSPSLLVDLVINQHLRPLIPEYVEDWARELLGRCWQIDPIARPRIGEILNVLSSNSGEVRNYEVWLREKYSENVRN